MIDDQSTEQQKPGLISKAIRRLFLRKFFNITLTATEAGLANDAVESKYRVALVQAAIFGALLLPALFLLDTEIVVSVLIPTTMVAGTAWFSVSLASIKAKFENFGMELTTDLFVAFSLSLLMLLLATATSLTRGFWESSLQHLANNQLYAGGAAALAVLVVGKLVVSIFAGSLKYDINDAMLTGQNEAAERFFKKSLSVLHNTSEVLKTGRSLHVANYSIGVAFYEVFSSIQESSPSSDRHRIKELVNEANKLITKPSMDEAQANEITISVTRAFLKACGESVPESKSDKSFIAIEDELSCLSVTQKLLPEKSKLVEQMLDEEINSSETGSISPLQLQRLKVEVASAALKHIDGAEDQEMTDLRISVILTEISNLIEEYGYRIRI